MQVTPQGQNGPQVATYNATLGAPRCLLPGTSCDSTASLLLGRGTLGPEPNQPNTVDACVDGTSGTFHSDESNDRLVVTSLNGFDFTEGQQVRVDATVWAWSSPSSDHLDLYYAANANSPTWTLIASLAPAAAGAQTLSATYTLPAGGLQAVRANFRYNGDPELVQRRRLRRCRRPGLRGQRAPPRNAPPTRSATTASSATAPRPATPAPAPPAAIPAPSARPATKPPTPAKPIRSP